MPSDRVSFLQVCSFVWSYWRRMPVRFAAIAAGVLAAVTLEVQIPALSARLVMALQGAGTSGDLGLAWRAAGWLLATFAAVSLARQAYLRMWIPFAARVMHHMVSEAFAGVQRFSADWHANHFAGSTQRKITRGMWAYDSFADLVVIDLGPAVLLLLAFSVTMFLREPLLGLCFGGAVVLFLAVNVAVSLGYVAPANRVANDADTGLGGALADALTCNPVVKSFGRERREDARLDRVAASWRARARRAWRRSIDAGALQSLLIVGLLGGLVAAVLGMAGRGGARLDDLVYVLTTYFIVNGYLRNVGWQVRNLQRAVNELDDLVALHHTAPQVRDLPGAPPFRPGPGRIRLEGVRFGYPNQSEPVFDGLQLEIAPGEKVALVGESGAGKSTLVKLVQRLHDVQAGRVVIDGQDVARVDQESLRAAIALVPQDPVLFHRSLRENIAYGRPGASEDEIVAAARQAHADGFIRRLRDGYESLVGERGIKLSGGERQRVAIARAILADAPILILDEATSSLDSITEHHIQEAIASLMKGRTAILIAHRLSTVRQADRILVFDRGRIVEEGTHDALMDKTDGVYRRLFDMQSLGFVDLPERPAAERQPGRRRGVHPSHSPA